MRSQADKSASYGASTGLRAGLRLRSALLDLCLERGYRDLELEDLLERAGVGEEDFRRHFDDLEDCFYAALVAIRDDFFADLQRRLVGRPEWRERLRATTYAAFRLLRGDQRISHLTVLDARVAGERAQLLLEAVNRRFFDLIDEGRAEPSAPAGLSRATAELIGGSILTQIYTAVGQGRRPSPQAVPELMYAAVLPYLGPEAAAQELRIAPPPDLVP